MMGVSIKEIVMRRSATLGVFLPGEGAVDAACAQNCRNAGFLSNNEFWSILRNTNTTMTVFRAGFIFNPQPTGTTTHPPALEVLNGQVFLAVRGTDPNALTYFPAPTRLFIPLERAWSTQSTHCFRAPFEADKGWSVT